MIALGLRPALGRLVALARGVAPAALRLAVCAALFYCAPTIPPASGAHPSATGSKHYVCAPCGGPCDATVVDHPGTCASCGMPLVEQGSAEAQAPPGRAVAILVFDGAEIIDFTGPWEVFGAAGFDVYTVAATREPVTTSMGMKVVPRYSFEDARPPSILLVPGGGVEGVRHDAATLRWLTDTSRTADVTLSVCNGAFILASAGLLEGLTATTTSHLTDRLAREFPRTHVVTDRRFVDNGRIVTAGGLTSGIDAALHVVERMLGKGAAQADALGLEYDWKRDAPFARGALADRLLHGIDLDALGTFSFDETHGTTEAWSMVIKGTSSRGGKELLDAITAQATREGRWRVVGSQEGSAEMRLEEADGRAWRCTIGVEGGAGKALVVRVEIRRTEG